ncbi:MAG: hypothetical protein JNL33_14160 [Betaproteobacteria bacterium]|nr:hypothetical protein [Betaproteobacteria bacterium]
MSRLAALIADFDAVHDTLPLGASTDSLARAARVFEIADFWIDPMLVAVKGDVTGKAQADIRFLVEVISELASLTPTAASENKQLSARSGQINDTIINRNMLIQKKN